MSNDELQKKLEEETDDALIVAARYVIAARDALDAVGDRRWRAFSKIETPTAEDKEEQLIHAGEQAVCHDFCVMLDDLVENIAQYRLRRIDIETADDKMARRRDEAGNPESKEKHQRRLQRYATRPNWLAVKS